MLPECCTGEYGFNVFDWTGLKEKGARKEGEW
jgi:hypothetical protein